MRNLPQRLDRRSYLCLNYRQMTIDSQPLSLPDIRAAIPQAIPVKIINKTKGETYLAEHAMTGRQVEMILSGSLLNLMRKRPA